MILDNPFNNLNIDATNNNQPKVEVVVQQNPNDKSSDPFDFIKKDFSPKQASYTKVTVARYVQE